MTITKIRNILLYGGVVLAVGGIILGTTIHSVASIAFGMFTTGMGMLIVDALFSIFSDIKMIHEREEKEIYEKNNPWE